MNRNIPAILVALAAGSAHAAATSFADSVPEKADGVPLAYIGKDTTAATALTLTAKPDGGDGDVVQDVAVGVGDAVLSVNGVGVKRDVRHDAGATWSEWSETSLASSAPSVALAACSVAPFGAGDSGLRATMPIALRASP